MEVTKENFDKVLPLIAEAIKECDFLAFDTELTGLASRNSRIMALDTVEERYQKIRASATSFQTIQWGLCAFKWDPQLQTFIARPFNIFVFPKPFNRTFEPTFLSQVSSLHFLATHKFDFNKLIYGGVSYMRKDDEQRIRQQFAPSTREEVMLTPDDQKFIAGVFEKIDNWLQNSTEKELPLEPCNPYLRRVSYQEIEKRYNQRLHAQTKEGEHYQRFLVVSRLTEEEKRQKEEEKKAVSEEELNQAIGFRKVLDLICESRKPLVGHNMMLDVVHTFSLMWWPPEICAEFKERLHSIFPSLVDTKYVATVSPVIGGLLPGTSLDEAYATVSREPFEGPKITFADGYNAYGQSHEAFHEAGFDAYATGVVYLRLAQHIASKTSDPNADILPEGDLMRPYLNKIFMMRSDIQYLNLTGPEAQPTRQNVFWVHGFSPQTRTSDIIRHFQPLGTIDIKWIDDTSLLATVQNPNIVAQVIPYFATVRPPFIVADFETYMASAVRVQRETPQRRPFTPSPPRRGMKRPYEQEAEKEKTAAPEEKPKEEEKKTVGKERDAGSKQADEPETKKRRTGDPNYCLIC